MKPFIAYLQSLSKKPWFILFRGFFIGAFVTSLQAAYEAGHVDMSLKALSHMIVGAAIASVIALWHYYLPQPNSGAATPAETERSNEKVDSGTGNHPV